MIHKFRKKTDRPGPPALTSMGVWVRIRWEASSGLGVLLLHACVRPNCNGPQCKAPHWQGERRDRNLGRPKQRTQPVGSWPVLSRNHTTLAQTSKHRAIRRDQRLRRQTGIPARQQLLRFSGPVCKPLGACACLGSSRSARSSCAMAVAPGSGRSLVALRRRNCRPLVGGRAAGVASLTYLKG